MKNLVSGLSTGGGGAPVFSAFLGTSSVIVGVSCEVGLLRGIFDIVVLGVASLFLLFRLLWVSLG